MTAVIFQFLGSAKFGISPAIYRPEKVLGSASDRYSDFKAALFRVLLTAGQRSIAAQRCPAPGSADQNQLR